MLGPVLFNIFNNDLDDGTECTLSNLTYCFWEEEFMHQMVLPSFRGTSRRGRKKWTETLWSSTVLHLGRNNCRHQHILFDWLESNFSEKHLGWWWMTSWTWASNAPLWQWMPAGSCSALGIVLPAGWEKQSFPANHGGNFNTSSAQEKSRTPVVA